MTSTTTARTLPIIDLREVETDPLGFQERLSAATRDFGFFYLVGHGIPRELSDDLVAVARRFFALPEEQKLAIEKINSPYFRGYSRVGDELTKGAQDWREQVDVGPETAPQQPTADEPWLVLEGPNLWPAEPADFRGIVEEWVGHNERVARTLLHGWLQALGQPADLLDDDFRAPDARLKIVRYPEAPDDDHGQGVGEHKDFGFLTLLFVEPGKGGLQVEKDGAWIEAEPLEDALIVNIGEMLEAATDGYLRATNHRVVSRPGDGDRISVPYFFNPGLGTTFHPWDLPAGLAAAAPGVEVQEHNKIYDTYGLNALKMWFRSHPKVTARHHAELAARLGI
ncbi:isopenicillin N synthase family dioxygenase [Georgenia ruanii]|uniref:Isopenicillin N synthase family oxygenase n=1 Tax=Georgenia ruanii TaxID=348442 RepID=A0A7J9UV38_9MICO|nr:2-oxoglutarate and iron-dependent oxygenase domain-containing protein [Georgenia ruanii]MPV87690.1 isopenicillin N synthase family oxygenase [Georgenia ruanii]